LHSQRNKKKTVEATLRLKTLYFSFLHLSLSPSWFIICAIQLAKGELMVEDYSATYGSSSCTFRLIVLVSLYDLQLSSEKVRMWFTVEDAVFIPYFFSQFFLIFLPVLK
jgi:hypothetical protein